MLYYSSYTQLAASSKRVRDTVVLTVAQNKIHVLQTLRGRALEQVVNCGHDHNSVLGRVHGKTANNDAVFATDLLDFRRLATDGNQPLVGLIGMETVALIPWNHCATCGINATLRSRRLLTSFS